MARVFGALFFDKLRGTVSLFVLVIIALLLGISHFFPQPVKLDSKTTDTFVQAADVMRKAASTMESAAQDNIQFRQSMQKELSIQAELRKSNYEALYDQYGIGSLPNNGGRSTAGFDYWLYPQDNPGGGGSLPKGKDDPGRTEQLQHTAEDSGKTTIGSNTGAPGGEPSPPNIKSGATGNVSGAKQLPKGDVNRE